MSFLHPLKKDLVISRNWVRQNQLKLCGAQIKMGELHQAPLKKIRLADGLIRPSVSVSVLVSMDVPKCIIKKKQNIGKRSELLHCKPIQVTEKQKKCFWNQTFDKGRLKNFVLWFFLKYGEHKTVRLVEELKTIGFQYATKAGISLGVEDLKIPPKKTALIYEAENLSTSTIRQFKRGEITEVERFQRLIDTWHRTSEQLKIEVIENFEGTDVLNPVYMMAFSGARGNISQVRQLVGMRGLMSNPQGQIIDFPIRSNFREGLTLTEYIISSYGARKGIVDTALRTANAGYLTRRLVDVAQHVIISSTDCGTSRGIFLTDMKEGNKIIYSLQNRLIGRVLARDIYNNQQKFGAGGANIKEVGSDKNGGAEFRQAPLKIASKNMEISGELASLIAQNHKKVFVRSPLTCQTNKLVCQLCYGWSLAQGNLVSIGEAVGIVAAQSIGEPGTQLTMRTFHTGGVFSGNVSDQIKAPFDGFVVYKNPIAGKLIRTPEGQIAFLTKDEGSFSVYRYTKNNGHLLEKDSSKKALEFNADTVQLEKRNFKIPFYTLLFLRNREKVFHKQVIAQISSINRQKTVTDQAELTIKAEISGLFYSKNLEIEETKVGPLLKDNIDGAENSPDSPNGLNAHSILDNINRAWNWGYAWILSGKIYQLPLPSTFFPIFGDFVTKKTFMNCINWYMPSTFGSGFKINRPLVFNIFNKISIKNMRQALSLKEDFILLPRNESLGLVGLAKSTTNPSPIKKSGAPLNQQTNGLLAHLYAGNQSNTSLIEKDFKLLKYDLISFELSNIFYKNIGYFLKLSQPSSSFSNQTYSISVNGSNYFSSLDNTNTINNTWGFSITNKNFALPLPFVIESLSTYSQRTIKRVAQKGDSPQKYESDPHSPNQYFKNLPEANSNNIAARWAISPSAKTILSIHDTLFLYTSLFPKNRFFSNVKSVNLEKRNNNKPIINPTNWEPSFSVFLNWFPKRFFTKTAGFLFLEPIFKNFESGPREGYYFSKNGFCKPISSIIFSSVAKTSSEINQQSPYYKGADFAAHATLSKLDNAVIWHTEKPIVSRRLTAFMTSVWPALKTKKAQRVNLLLNTTKNKKNRKTNNLVKSILERGLAEFPKQSSMELRSDNEVPKKLRSIRGLHLQNGQNILPQKNRVASENFSFPWSSYKRTAAGGAFAPSFFKKDLHVSLGQYYRSDPDPSSIANRLSLVKKSDKSSAKNLVHEQYQKNLLGYGSASQPTNQKRSAKFGTSLMIEWAISPFICEQSSKTIGIPLFLWKKRFKYNWGLKRNFAELHSVFSDFKNGQNLLNKNSARRSTLPSTITNIGRGMRSTPLNRESSTTPSISNCPPTKNRMMVNSQRIFWVAQPFYKIQDKNNSISLQIFENKYYDIPTYGGAPHPHNLVGSLSKINRQGQMKSLYLDANLVQFLITSNGKADNYDKGASRPLLTRFMSERCWPYYKGGDIILKEKTIAANIKEVGFTDIDIDKYNNNAIIATGNQWKAASLFYRLTINKYKIFKKTGFYRFKTFNFTRFALYKRANSPSRLFKRKNLVTHSENKQSPQNGLHYTRLINGAPLNLKTYCKITSAPYFLKKKAERILDNSLYSKSMVTANNNKSKNNKCAEPPSLDTNIMAATKKNLFDFYFYSLLNKNFKLTNAAFIKKMDTANVTLNKNKHVKKNFDARSYAPKYWLEAKSQANKFIKQKNRVTSDEICSPYLKDQFSTYLPKIKSKLDPKKGPSGPMLCRSPLIKEDWRYKTPTPLPILNTSLLGTTCGDVGHQNFSRAAQLCSRELSTSFYQNIYLSEKEHNLFQRLKQLRQWFKKTNEQQRKHELKTRSNSPKKSSDTARDINKQQKPSSELDFNQQRNCNIWLKKGWFYYTTDLTKFFLYHKKLIQTGKNMESHFIFDRNTVYIEIIPVNKHTKTFFNGIFNATHEVGLDKKELSRAPFNITKIISNKTCRFKIVNPTIFNAQSFAPMSKDLNSNKRAELRTFAKWTNSPSTTIPSGLFSQVDSDSHTSFNSGSELGPNNFGEGVSTSIKKTKTAFIILIRKANEIQLFKDIESKKEIYELSNQKNGGSVIYNLNKYERSSAKRGLLPGLQYNNFRSNERSLAELPKRSSDKNGGASTSSAQPNLIKIPKNKQSFYTIPLSKQSFSFDREQTFMTALLKLNMQFWSKEKKKNIFELSKSLKKIIWFKTKAVSLSVNKTQNFLFLLKNITNVRSQYKRSGLQASSSETDLRKTQRVVRNFYLTKKLNWNDKKLSGAPHIERSFFGTSFRQQSSIDFKKTEQSSAHLFLKIESKKMKAKLLNKSYHSIRLYTQYKTGTLNKQKITSQISGAPLISKYPSSELKIISNKTFYSFLAHIDIEKETLHLANPISRGESLAELNVEPPLRRKKSWQQIRGGPATASSAFGNADFSSSIMLTCLKTLNLAPFILSYKAPYTFHFPFKTPMCFFSEQYQPTFLFKNPWQKTKISGAYKSINQSSNTKILESNVFKKVLTAYLYKIKKQNFFHNTTEVAVDNVKKLKKNTDSKVVDSSANYGLLSSFQGRDVTKKTKDLSVNAALYNRAKLFQVGSADYNKRGFADYDHQKEKIFEIGKTYSNLSSVFFLPIVEYSLVNDFAKSIPASLQRDNLKVESTSSFINFKNGAELRASENSVVGNSNSYLNHIDNKNFLFGSNGPILASIILASGSPTSNNSFLRLRQSNNIVPREARDQAFYLKNQTSLYKTEFVSYINNAVNSQIPCIKTYSQSSIEGEFIYQKKNLKRQPRPFLFESTSILNQRNFADLITLKNTTQKLSIDKIIRQKFTDYFLANKNIGHIDNSCMILTKNDQIAYSFSDLGLRDFTDLANSKRAGMYAERQKQNFASGKNLSLFYKDIYLTLENLKKQNQYFINDIAINVLNLLVNSSNRDSSKSSDEVSKFEFHELVTGPIYKSIISQTDTGSIDLTQEKKNANEINQAQYNHNWGDDQMQKKQSVFNNFTNSLQKSGVLELNKIPAGFAQQKSRLLIGEFLVYGDKIHPELAITKGGQIIHINNNKITLRKGQPIFVSPQSILHKYDGDFVDEQSSVITLTYQQLKTGDIVQGIPKIEQFFEARTTKRGRLFRDSLENLLKALFNRYNLKLTREQAVRQSFYKIQQIIIDGVQRVYRSQGVTIADKHLEVIVKQMTSKVRITFGGSTGYLPGEICDLYDIELLNKDIRPKILYEPIVLGITKASLEVKSFLSAASFQQTTRVLTKAALSRKNDYLNGLKENVILGNLIPAGTGYLVYLD
jgi:hypothetical protein